MYRNDLLYKKLSYDIQGMAIEIRKIYGSGHKESVYQKAFAIEIKALGSLPQSLINQLFDYLKNSKYELGYLINFSSPKLYMKRIIYTNDRKNFSGF